MGGSGTTVRWRAGDSTTVSYAVYRIPVTDHRVKPDDCVVADATNLVATMRAVSGYQTWTDTSAGGQRYTYVITGLDRTVERVGPAAGHAQLTRSATTPRLPNPPLLGHV